MKLIIGNKAYSSWSLRGWLACKQAGLPFEEIVVPLYDAEWDRRRGGGEFAPSGGKVPLLWDGDDIVVWDSLAIIEYLADKVGRDRFWPVDDAARAMARSMAAERHSSFTALRRQHPMNVRQIFPAQRPDEDVFADLARIMQLWAQARANWGGGGEFLFGGFGAADIMYAPVVTRLMTYQLPLPRFAAAYGAAVIGHPWMQQWIAEAQEEEWVIEQYEQPAATA